MRRRSPLTRRRSPLSLTLSPGVPGARGWVAQPEQQADEREAVEHFAVVDHALDLGPIEPADIMDFAADALGGLGHAAGEEQVEGLVGGAGVGVVAVEGFEAFGGVAGFLAEFAADGG